MGALCCRPVVGNKDEDDHPIPSPGFTSHRAGELKVPAKKVDNLVGDKPVEEGGGGDGESLGLAPASKKE